MSKHHKHNHQRKAQANHTTTQTIVHEVERYNRSDMTDYCLNWSVYLSELGNEAESEVALLWASWIDTATAHEFNTACDAWYQWELEQPRQLDLFAA